MAKHANFLYHHGDRVPQKLKSFAIWHREGLEISLTKFEVDQLNPLRGVSKSPIPVNCLKMACCHMTYDIIVQGIDYSLTI